MPTLLAWGLVGVSVLVPTLVLALDIPMSARARAAKFQATPEPVQRPATDANQTHAMKTAVAAAPHSQPSVMLGQKVRLQLVRK